MPAGVAATRPAELYTVCNQSQGDRKSLQHASFRETRFTDAQANHPQPLSTLAGVPVRASLFIACYNDTFYPEVGKATVRVLERMGVKVDFPMTQTCCGQMHFNSGYRREVVPMMENFLRAFADSELIVAASASCAGLVRDLYPGLADEHLDAATASEVKELAARTHELSMFLTGVLQTDDVGAYFPHRVTYHPTCHSMRMLGVGDAPVRLLQNVAGLEYVPLPNANECCGFGGTFAVKNSDTSMAMLTDKLSSVLSTRVEYCTAVDTSCLMHIGGALHRQRAPVRTLHIAEILASTAADYGEKHV